MAVLAANLAVYGWHDWRSLPLRWWGLVPALLAAVVWRLLVTPEPWWQGPMGLGVWLGFVLAIRWIGHGFARTPQGFTPGIGLAEMQMFAIGGLWLGWGELPSFMALTFVLTLGYLPLWGWLAEQRSAADGQPHDRFAIGPVLALSLLVHVVWGYWGL